MTDPNSSVNYWNGVADEKTFSHPLNRRWLTQYLKTSALILDFGCGYGRTLKELSTLAYRNTIGMDFSIAMLNRSRRDLAHVNLIQSDGRTIPLKDGSLDALLLFAVLTCIPRDDNQKALIAEIRRVLRSGGLIYISDLLLNDDERNVERYEYGARIFDTYGVFELPEGVCVRHHTKEWIENLTGAFTRLEYEPFTALTMNGNQSAAFQYLGSN